MDTPIPKSNGLTNILDLYTKTRGTSSSSTTQSNISKEGVDGLIQQILSSTQGLAQVSSGARSAGLYNSSGQSMITNDLLSQTASKVAALQGGTTTSQRSGGLAGNDAKTALLLMAGKSILGPSISGAAKKLGFGGAGKNIGQSFADMLGLGDGSQVTDSIGGSITGGTDVSEFSVLDQVDPGSLGIDFSSFFSDAGTDLAASSVTDAGTELLTGFFG